MALSDDIMARYRSRKGGGEADPPAKDEGETEAKGKHTAGKALLAAVRRGDAEAVEEAIRSCVNTEY